MMTSQHSPLSEEDLADLHELYRHLHQHPELSMQETETGDLIAGRMRALGAEVFRCGGTGVVATLRNGPGDVVAFRADIDGLPVQEQSGVDYASRATGVLPDGTSVPVMHACGHDTHIVCALGAATALAQREDEWAGTAVFIFQPAEETAQGAVAMVDDGLWDRAPMPDVVFGQHVGNAAAGTIQISSGPAMAMADAWEVTVHGRGGHGSQPHTTIDPVVLAAHMVVRLQTVVAREVAPQEAAVVTIASFHAGLKENIIPAEATFTINVRSLTPDVREQVLSAIRRIVDAEAQAAAAPAPTIVESYHFPLTFNDAQSTDRLVTDLASRLGASNVHHVEPRMGSEDFGHLPSTAGVPGVYWFFGGMPESVINSDEPTPSNHSPFFAPAIEPTLTTGITAAWGALMSRLSR